MINWLQNRLPNISNFIVKAGLFGSVAVGKTMPNDCDLYFVSNTNPSSIEWHNIKKEINKIRKEFYSQFEIYLNVILLTIGEWEEKEGFFSGNIPITLIENRPTRHCT